ncbi:hydrogenase 2 operon protein HybA [Candidatus Parabeggiatoa sp. HSG14]|uniref:hydrogenase 2 operon protein HybA n=1 Tax=Candidatus Parabeggiatoa sp. HSG14 TaxID=3055593 RepID=UPI0025A873C3|nr:hydrogenase 2 operon protein HybA [Thiotrichales bacterium HSG14]
MAINRRNFLKAATGSALTAIVAEEAQAFSPRETKELPPKAVGMLYDSTLCIGCKACVAACKQANDQPLEILESQQGWNEGAWDSAIDISAKTLNVIKAYTNGEMTQKDREVDGYAFMKRHCLHCVDPSCVSVCPVSAMQKDPITGVVTHNPDACIGCRYCVVGCPFSVPQFDYETPFPQIHKCQFCSHLQAQGKLPACCDVCPTGASLFGDVRELKEEAKRRLGAEEGEVYEFPRGKLGGDRDSHTAQIPKYQKDFYGDTELGGTQVMYLSGVPFDKLGLPTNVPDKSYASISEGIQHTLYKGMIAPLTLLSGLLFMAYRNRKHHDDDEQSPKEDL